MFLRASGTLHLRLLLLLFLVCLFVFKTCLNYKLNMLGKNGLCKVFHNGIRERCCSKVFVRGYFHFLLYRRLRVPATFLKSPSQLLLFKYFDWLIHTGFSLIIVLFCFVLFCFCQLFAQRRIIRRKLKHMQT